MMYVHLNLNRDNKFVGDCVVRAIAKLLNQSWERTYIDLVIQGYILADMPSSDVVWQAYLRWHGFSRYVIPNTCPDCYTVADFAADHPTGNYLLFVGQHVVTVVDGDYYDSGDSEFSDVVNGMNINDVLTVIEELMETLRVANSSTGRLYNATLRKLKDI